MKKEIQFSSQKFGHCIYVSIKHLTLCEKSQVSRSIPEQQLVDGLGEDGSARRRQPELRIIGEGEQRATAHPEVRQSVAFVPDAEGAVEALQHPVHHAAHRRVADEQHLSTKLPASETQSISPKTEGVLTCLSARHLSGWSTRGWRHWKGCQRASSHQQESGVSHSMHGSIHRPDGNRKKAGNGVKSSVGKSPAN